MATLYREYLNPPAFNLQFAFCDEIKTFLSGYARSGNTYTSNGSVGLIQELGVKTTFRKYRWHFDEALLETIETLAYSMMIKAKGYPTLVSKGSDQGLTFVPGEDGRETAVLVVDLDSWKIARGFILKRVR